MVIYNIIIKKYILLNIYKMGIIQSICCCFGNKDTSKMIVRNKSKKIKEIVDDTEEVIEDVIDMRSNIIELINDTKDCNYQEIIEDLHSIKNDAIETIKDASELIMDIDDLL